MYVGIIDLALNYTQNFKSLKVIRTIVQKINKKWKKWNILGTHVFYQTAWKWKKFDYSFNPLKYTICFIPWSVFV